MARRADIIITTSATLEGWTIHEYVDTVSAHVVGGTNMFRDLFAGLSDVFGGRSHAYQKELAALDSEVLRSLIDKAKTLRTDAVIGVRVDHDEISGGGKSMFMVTALGTAVRAKRNTVEETGTAIEDVLTAQDLRVETGRRNLKAAADKGTLTSLNNRTWDFITNNQIHELADFVLEQVAAGPESKDEPDRKRHSQLQDRARAYLLSLPAVHAEAAATHALKSWDAADAFVYDLIGEGGFLNLTSALELLQDENLAMRRKAIQLLQFDKEVYLAADIPLFEGIIEAIKMAFPPIVEEVSERALFGSKMKNLWECSCGVTRKRDIVYCERCGNDPQGFKEREAKPRLIETQLSAKVAVLRDRVA